LAHGVDPSSSSPWSEVEITPASARSAAVKKAGGLSFATGAAELRRSEIGEVSESPPGAARPRPVVAPPDSLFSHDSLLSRLATRLPWRGRAGSPACPPPLDGRPGGLRDGPDRQVLAGEERQRPADLLAA
jgi:hypothetical protein